MCQKKNYTGQGTACALAVALWPFGGYGRFQSIDTSGNITYYTTEWPDKQYIKLIETWTKTSVPTGSYTRTSQFTDYCDSSGMSANELQYGPYVTGAPPSGGDYYSTTSGVADALITSTGFDGSYTATLTPWPDSWSAATTNCLALLALMSVPSMPGTDTDFDAYAGLPSSFASNIAQTVATPDSMGNPYAVFTSGALKWRPFVGGACAGMPCVTHNINDPYIAVPGISDAMNNAALGTFSSPSLNANRGFVMCASSRWRVRGNINTIPPGFSFLNTNDHRTVYAYGLSLSGSTFSPVGSPSIVSTGFHDGTFDAATISAPGEIGFRSSAV